MKPASIDEYLEGVDGAARATLEQLRRSIREVVPDAEECISYGLPAFRIHGKIVAGFAAFKNHLSYLPHSGSVLSTLSADLRAYEGTKSSLHFSRDEPLPDGLVRKLVTGRLAQIDQGTPLRG